MGALAERARRRRRRRRGGLGGRAAASVEAPKGGSKIGAENKNVSIELSGVDIAHHFLTDGCMAKIAMRRKLRFLKAKGYTRLELDRALHLANKGAVVTADSRRRRRSSRKWPGGATRCAGWSRARSASRRAAPS